MLPYKSLSLWGYLVQRYKKKWKTAIILIFIISLSIFLPLQVLENYQNSHYILVMSQRPLSRGTVSEIAKITGVTYTAELNYSLLHRTLVLTVNPDFEIFVSKYIVCGVFPEKESEIAVVIDDENNTLVLGASVSVNNTTYRIVGIITSDWLFLSSHSIGAQQTFIRVTKKQINPSILYLGYSFFVNESKILNKVEKLVGAKSLVFLSGAPNVEKAFVEMVLVGSIILSMAVVLILVLDLRYDLALLYALAWPRRWILKRLLLEVFFLYSLGYLFCYIFLVMFLNYLSKFYIFANFDILFYVAGLFGLDLATFFLFTKYLCFNKGIEVLVE